MRRFLLPCLVIATASCVSTASPTYGALPKERTNECVQDCQQLGLTMTAVVVMGSSVGCVCEPGRGASGTAQRAGGAAAGGVMVLQQQTAQQQARASHP